MGICAQLPGHEDAYAQTVVLSHLHTITAIFLPRQARDKHIGKALKKDTTYRVLSGSTTTHAS